MLPDMAVVKVCGCRIYRAIKEADTEIKLSVMVIESYEVEMGFWDFAEEETKGVR